MDSDRAARAGKLIAATRALCLAGALALAATAAKAQEWQSEVNENGVGTATVTTDAVLGEHAAPAAVRFQCADGEGGTLSILLIVRDTRFVPDFPFDTFEGPDAVTRERPLYRVEVGGESVGFGFDLYVDGWYVEQYAFVFGHAARNGTDSQVARIADAVRKGATTMTVGVAMPDGSDRWLLAKVPMTNAAAAVAEVTEPCR
jgi:hypothetical protein